MASADENSEEFRNRMYDRYGEEGAKRIAARANIFFIRKYAPESVIQQRFEDLMWVNDYGVGDFDYAQEDPSSD